MLRFISRSNAESLRVRSNTSRLAGRCSAAIHARGLVVLAGLFALAGGHVAGRPAIGADETAPAAKASAETPAPRLGVLIRFEGSITPLTQKYLYRKLDEAREAGADLIVIEIDSPGGMLGPTLEIAERLRDLAWARTVAWIPREALSGAAILSLGCDEIVMHPQAKIGDAGPIYLNEGGIFEHAPEKLRTDLARHVRDLAESKGRPPALAEAMVDKELKIFLCRNRADGAEVFLREHDLEAAVPPDQWERLAAVEETLRGNFLEVNGRRAVELKIASATAEDREALRRHLRLEAPWVVKERGTTDVAVAVLNSPLIAVLLIVIGLVALFIELSSPGVGFGGLTAFLCFALFFWSKFLGGTAGWLEATLFLVGAVFLGVELFMIPGFGVAGIAGIALMVGSLIMAFQEFIIPHSRQELGTLAQGVGVVSGSIVLFMAAASLLSRHMRSAPFFRRLVLVAPESDQASEAGGPKWLDPQGKPLAAPGPESETGVFVGDWGAAQTALRPAGRARFGARVVDVIADSAFIEAGRQVRVLDVQGNRVTVAEVRET